MIETPEYEVIFHERLSGQCPMDEFLDSLPLKVRAKLMKWIEKLEEEGPHLPRPYADVICGKIRELRLQFASNQYRCLYRTRSGSAKKGQVSLASGGDALFEHDADEASAHGTLVLTPRAESNEPDFPRRGKSWRSCENNASQAPTPQIAVCYTGHPPAGMH